MSCTEKTYLLIKRPGEAQEYNTKTCSVELLTTKSRHVDVHPDLGDLVDLHVRIPRWLKMALYLRLNEIYGGHIPKGALGQLVTKLLSQALEATPANASSRPRDLGRAGAWRYREECERILAILKVFITPGIQPGGKVSYVLLAQAITMARGRKERKGPFGLKADKRTIKNWIERMKRLGYIAETASSTYAVLWVPDEKQCQALLGDLWDLAQATRR